MVISNDYEQSSKIGVNGLSRKWIELAHYWQVPSSSSISEARQSIGCRVMSQLFEIVVRPLATAETLGAFLGELRVMAVDGTVLDVPDSEANARAFGYPGTRPGTKAAFPKVRLVLLVEAGTHLIVDAIIPELSKNLAQSSYSKNHFIKELELNVSILTSPFSTLLRA